MSETYEKIPRKERIPILNITNRTETTSDCQFYLLCVILHIYRSPAYVYCGQELVVVTCASMWNLYWYSRSYIFQSLIFSPAFSGPAFSTHAFSVPHFSVQHFPPLAFFSPAFFRAPSHIFAKLWKMLYLTALKNLSNNSWIRIQMRKTSEIRSVFPCPKIHNYSGKIFIKIRSVVFALSCWQTNRQTPGKT